MSRLTEWIVPPVIVPMFLGLLILAAAACMDRCAYVSSDQDSP